LSFQLNQITLLRQLADLGDSRRGLLGDVIRSTRGSVPGRYFEQIESYVEIVTDSVRAMGFHVERYFETLYRFLEGSGAMRPGEYINQVRITPELRQQPEWAHVEEAWNVLSQFTQAISNAMGRLARGLAGLGEFDVL